jgi:HSP20 family protein
VQRWDLFQELEGLHEQLGQMMLRGGPDGGAAAPWVPAVDIEETEDAWIVEAELPGVRKADLNVDVRAGELAISGEIKERERKGILRRRTRPVGNFEYRVTLPGEIDPEGVDASVSDGVLTIRIPKSDRTRSRRVEVSQGQAQGQSNGQSQQG